MKNILTILLIGISLLLGACGSSLTRFERISEQLSNQQFKYTSEMIRWAWDNNVYVDATNKDSGEVVGIDNEEAMDIFLTMIESEKIEITQIDLKEINDDSIHLVLVIKDLEIFDVERAQLSQSNSTTLTHIEETHESEINMSEIFTQLNENMTLKEMIDVIGLNPCGYESNELGNIYYWLNEDGGRISAWITENYGTTLSAFGF